MPAHQSSILFHHPASGISRRRVRNFAARLQAQVTGGGAFDVLLSDDAELHRLNREFRKRNYATDVLSFPAPCQNGFLGDLAISIERARAQALEHEHSIEQEVQILMLHGVLHLLGQDHEKDTGQMARLERKWRRRFHLPAGLTERIRA